MLKPVWIERHSFADEARPIEDCRRRAGDVRAAEQALPKNLEAAAHTLPVRQSVEVDLALPQSVGTDQPDRVGEPSHLHHALQALWVEPVVSLDNLAEFTLRTDGFEGPIVVQRRRRELVKAEVPHSRVKGAKTGCNLRRLVGAAVVDNGVLPAPVRLREHTFDALTEIGRAVVDRRDDTHKWVFRLLCWHRSRATYSSGIESPGS